MLIDGKKKDGILAKDLLMLHLEYRPLLYFAAEPHHHIPMQEARLFRQNAQSNLVLRH